MLASSRCHICEVDTAERTILVLQLGPRVNDWPLCEACWRLLKRGIRRTRPDGTVETVPDLPDVHLTEPQLLNLIAAGLQAHGDSLFTLEAQLEQERRRLLLSRLRAIGGELAIALAAIASGDRTEVLKAIRRIEGRAKLIRAELERDLKQPSDEMPVPESPESHTSQDHGTEPA